MKGIKERKQSYQLYLKFYERTFSGQIAIYIDNILSPYLFAYRKGNDTQHALLRLIEKCRSFLDMKGFAGAILMNLSKAFDCLNHMLLISKLEAYSLCTDSTGLLYRRIVELNSNSFLRLQ